MITINVEQRTVTLQAANESPPITFPLLLGYICPKCKRILRAYWQNDDSSYNPLEYLSERDSTRSSYEEFYIAFQVPSAKGIELQNHKCRGVYIHLSLVASVQELITRLCQATITSPSTATRRPHSIEEIIQFLQTYGAEFITNICQREQPMLILMEDAVLGSWNHGSESFEVFDQRRTQRVQTFLKFFYNEKSEKNG